MRSYKRTLYRIVLPLLGLCFIIVSNANAKTDSHPEVAFPHTEKLFISF